jgi:hypothetical protein
MTVFFFAEVKSSMFSFRCLCDCNNQSSSYINQSVAFQNQLAYVTADGKVIMKGDDFTTLPLGTYRDRSVDSHFLFSLFFLMY